MTLTLRTGLLVALVITSIEGAGRTVTDGFVSTFVRPSPDREDETDCRRVFDVYLPEEFDTNPEMTFPIVYHLTGFGGNNTTYSVTDREVMDAMIAQGTAVPMIIVAPDPRVLSYDGSFWVDSLVVGEPGQSFNGKFEEYMIKELIPFVDQKYRQKKTADGRTAPFRAIMGQSMGGYGSYFFGIKYPDLFSGFAGDSATAFWTISTNLASPDGNSMFTFNKLLIPELNKNGRITPDNGPNTFGFYAWAAAFSPQVLGLAPDQCNFLRDSCLNAPPFCIEYPFLVDADSVPRKVNGSFIEDPKITSIWQTYNPYFMLDTADKEKLKRQAIYLDAGSDLDLEPIDNVGAFYFSKKLTSFDLNHEHLLFDGGHVSCTTEKEIECYRFTTNLKLFSGKFAEAGVFANDIRTKITGTMTLEFTDSSVMQINDKRLVGIESDVPNGVTNTDITIRLKDSARFEIGTEDIIGGSLQVGNAYGKANLLFDPVRNNSTVAFTLEIDGPKATFQIGRQGFLGLGIGMDGNLTAVPNFWALSTLANVTTVTLNFLKGRFLHNQIASSLNEDAAVLAIGQASKGFSLTLAKEGMVIAGGANLATITQGNRIHPTIQTTGGSINPGGIRNKIVERPATTFDDFYGPPKGFYASNTYSLNVMNVALMSSSLMLFDTNKTPLPPVATQQELFTFLMVNDYLSQGRKRAPVSESGNQLLYDYTLNQGTDLVRNQVNLVPQDPRLSVPFPTQKIIGEGAVGIKVATIDGVKQVIRLYDLDPDV